MKEEDESKKEDLEGLEDEQDSLGEYPIDSLLIRQDNRSIFEVIRRINKGEYLMNPDFQRDLVWKDERQSRLIESCLLRIPLPVFYLAEKSDGKVIVVDGLQRLSTFKRFIDNELTLSGLAKNTHLNGKKFKDLTPQQQNRFEDTPLILYLIDQRVPDEAKLDIFDRVNSGVPLTRQQMRNALYNGPATKTLANLAEEKDFLEATGKSLDPGKMRDREAINRYFVFKLLGYENYQGKINESLSTILKQINTMSESQIDELKQDFLKSMRNNFAVFGIHSFRKHGVQQVKRNVLNMALFDVYSYYFSNYSEEEVQEKKDILLDRFFSLMENDEFINSITLGTNQKNKIQTRFRLVGETMKVVFEHD